MELANGKFGTELSNNSYYGLTAVVVGGKPKPKAKPSGTTYVTPGGSAGTPVAAPGASTSKGAPTPIVVVTPPVDTPVYSAPAPSGGSGGGSGGGGGSEEKAPEEKAEDTKGTEVKGTEPSFFQKPIGKVSVLIALAALLYGGYRVMKSK